MLCLCVAAVAFGGPTAASAAWREPVGGIRPISDIGDGARLASVGNVPYVAWEEAHGPTRLVFVARLNATGTHWEKVGGPVNADLHASRGTPGLTSVDGVPYVAWITAPDPMSCATDDVRVARLNAAGDGWVQPWRGEDSAHGGLKQNAGKCVGGPDVAAVAGVPYVTWNEETQGGADSVVRVAQLDTGTTPLATWTEPWTGVDASHGGLPELARYGNQARLAAVGATPYVTWVESTLHYGDQVQVARLNPGNHTWEQPWSKVSATYGGINESLTGNGAEPTLASVRSYPYVAWTEFAGTAYQARVARLDTSTPGTPTWTQEANGVSPTDGRINQSPTSSATDLTLTSVRAGPSSIEVPYLAWLENTTGPSGPTQQARVARFGAGTRAWEQPWAGVSQDYGAINLAPTSTASSPGLATIGGVPWIVRSESGVRVSRLEPDFATGTVAADSTRATFSVVAHTFGIPYPLGFEYGNQLQHDSTVQPGPTGLDSVTVTRRVADLTPATAYQSRPFARAGVDSPRALGPLTAFTTAAAAKDPSGRATLSALSETNAIFAVGRPSSPVVAGRRRHRVGTIFSFRLDRPATVNIVIRARVPGRRAGRTCRPLRRVQRHSAGCTRLVTAAILTRRAGNTVNRIRFTGRIHGRALLPSRYEALFTPVNPAGKSTSGSLGFVVVRR